MTVGRWLSFADKNIAWLVWGRNGQKLLSLAANQFYKIL